MADQHPLPWKWDPASAATAGGVLRDANGQALLYGSGGGPLGVAIEDDYVRAVTERAKALDLVLRAVLALAQNRTEVRDPGDALSVADALLAEIDAAKAGGG